MTVLITGVDGFVGSHLAEAFAGRPGVTLVGTVRSLSGRAEAGASFRQLRLDVTDPAEVRRVLFEIAPQKIFHTAGQAFVPASVNDPYETFRTNIDGVINLLETVRALRAERQNSCAVLCISSGEVYGPPAAERLPIGEEVPLNPANPYAVSKACADLIARQYRATFGVDVVVARPFNHLGPRQSELFVGSAFARQIAEIRLGIREPKVLVGNTEPVRDFTDVRDVVRAYIALLEHPQAHGVFNVCSERGVAVGELLSILRELSGIDIEVVPDPDRIRRNEIPRITGSAARLREATGWAPEIPLRRTLADLLAYWEDRLRASA